MKRSDVQKLKPGMYRIDWKEGGASLAAVGVTRAGGRWLAPLNWVCPAQDERVWRDVDRATLAHVIAPSLIVKTGA